MVALTDISLTVIGPGAPNTSATATIDEKFFDYEKANNKKVLKEIEVGFTCIVAVSQSLAVKAKANGLVCQFNKLEGIAPLVVGDVALGGVCSGILSNGPPAVPCACTFIANIVASQQNNVDVT
jgi:hypothetical protein